MTDIRKAAEMALEALIGLYETPEFAGTKDVSVDRLNKKRSARESISALRQALAQPDEVLAEREACAKLCDDRVDAEYATGKVDHNEMGWTQACAQAIRARSEKPPVKSYCGGKPNYCTPEVTPEVTGGAFVLDRGCWERGCVAYDERDVDAVNISAERVDETAKREHEPVAWFVQYSDSHEFLWDKPKGWRVEQALEIQPLYTAPPKREWVGLTDEEIIKCFDSVAFGQVEDDLIINKHVNIFRAIHYIEAKLKEKNFTPA